MEKEENVYEETTPTEEFAEASENGALTVLGKFKDVGALVRAYESLQAEFTRRSQRLRQLEKASENFKKKERLSGAEKLRKAAESKRDEQKEFDAFIADTVSRFEENKKPDAETLDVCEPNQKGEEDVLLEEREKENKVQGETHKAEVLRMETAQGLDAKAARRRAERETEKEITVWHCRNCAEHGCGCCGAGDIRFNVVGEGDWALKAERKGDESRN